MEETRRNFLQKTIGLTTGTSLAGCVTKLNEEPDALYLRASPNRIETDLNGEDIYTELQGYVVDEELERVFLESREPGEEIWNILERQKAEDKSAQIIKSYTTDIEGQHDFQLTAELDDDKYTREEYVIFK